MDPLPYLGPGIAFALLAYGLWLYFASRDWRILLVLTAATLYFAAREALNVYPPLSAWVAALSSGSPLGVVRDNGSFAVIAIGTIAILLVLVRARPRRGAVAKRAGKGGIKPKP